MKRGIFVRVVIAVVFCVMALFLIPFLIKKAHFYNPRPEVTVIYADIQPIPGPPRPGCGGFSVPVMRIWGDGLAYLSNAVINGDESVWLGNLTAEQVADQLAFLDQQGFLYDWPIQTATPSGTSFTLGVNLDFSSIKIDVSSSDIYFRLENRLIPLLTPVKDASALDQRVKSAISAPRWCK